MGEYFLRVYNIFPGLLILLLGIQWSSTEK